MTLNWIKTEMMILKVPWNDNNITRPSLTGCEKTQNFSFISMEEPAVAPHKALAKLRLHSFCSAPRHHQSTHGRSQGDRPVWEWIEQGQSTGTRTHVWNTVMFSCVPTTSEPTWLYIINMLKVIFCSPSEEYYLFWVCCIDLLLLLLELYNLEMAAGSNLIIYT